MSSDIRGRRGGFNQVCVVLRRVVCCDVCCVLCVCCVCVVLCDLLCVGFCELLCVVLCVLMCVVLWCVLCVVCCEKGIQSGVCCAAAGALTGCVGGVPTSYVYLHRVQVFLLTCVMWKCSYYWRCIVWKYSFYGRCIMWKCSYKVVLCASILTYVHRVEVFQLTCTVCKYSYYWRCIMWKCSS